MKNILALDLGTNTGYAVHCKEIPRDDAGTWCLGTRETIARAVERRLDRKQDPRFLHLLAFIRQYRVSFPSLDTIVFEDVEFGTSRMQCHLWATWRAAIWVQQGIDMDCLATGKLKQFATGKGNADKNMMARALVARDPERYEIEVPVRPPRNKSRDLLKLRPVDNLFVRDKLNNKILDDNAVDAVHLLEWAKQTFK